MSRLSENQKKSVVFFASVIGTIKKESFLEGFFVSEENKRKLKDVIKNFEELSEVFGLYNSEAQEIRKDVKAGKYRVEVLNSKEFKDHLEYNKQRRIPVRQDVLDQLTLLAIGNECDDCKRNPNNCSLNKILQISYRDYDPEKRIIICPRIKTEIRKNKESDVR